MTDVRATLQALIEKYRVREDSPNNRLKALIRELEALASLPVSLPVSQLKDEEEVSRVEPSVPCVAPIGSTASVNEPSPSPAPDDECPNCDRGLRGSFPLCIDCQLVEALRNGE